MRSALAACAPFGVDAVRSAPLRGLGPPPPARQAAGLKDEFRHPLFMAYLDLDELPGLLDGRPAVLRAAPRAGLVPPRRSPRRPRARRSPSRCASSVAERTGAAPGGPDRAAHPPALLRAQLQPRQLLLLLRAARGSVRGRRRRTSPTRPGARATPTCSMPAANADRGTRGAVRAAASRRSSTSRR